MTLNFSSTDRKPAYTGKPFYFLPHLRANFGCWFASSLRNEQHGRLQGKKHTWKTVLRKKWRQTYCLWTAFHVPAFLGRTPEEMRPHEHNVEPKHVILHLRESAWAQNNLGVNTGFWGQEGFFFLFKNDVFLNDSRTTKELKVFKRERKAQPGQERVTLMEKEEEMNDVLGSAASPPFSRWLSQLQAHSQLRLAGLYPSAYWCGQALVDVPLFWTLMGLMFGVILLFNPAFPLESWTVPPMVSVLYAGKQAVRNPPPSFCSEFFALNILIEMDCSRQVFIYPHPSPCHWH